MNTKVKIRKATSGQRRKVEKHAKRRAAQASRNAKRWAPPVE